MTTVSEALVIIHKFKCIDQIFAKWLHCVAAFQSDTHTKGSRAPVVEPKAK